jgi:DNA-directed RNA polymerase specialized sigma24 family protein
LIPGLLRGDRQAVTSLWERYYRPLVRLAEERLRNARCRAADAEDVAAEAFLSFCRQLARPDAAERFPDLDSRTHLWRLLACFTVREAFDFRAKEERRGRTLRGDSAVGEFGFAQFPGREPPPEFSAAVHDLLAQLDGPELRDLALRRMEGHTVEEVARLFGWSVSKVERKLGVIRATWRARAADGSAEKTWFA